MAVVAGLFDSEADATAAMDKLMRMHLHDLDTRVFGQEERAKRDDSNVVLPLVPNTGNGPMGMPGGAVPFEGNTGMLNDIRDEEERGFYLEGMKEGATLAVAKVDDHDADQVRQLFRQEGARTYEKK